MCHARGKYNWLLNFDQAMGHAAVAAMDRPATAPHSLVHSVLACSRGIKREIKGLLKIKDWVHVCELGKVLSIMNGNMVKDLAVERNAG